MGIQVKASNLQNVMSLRPERFGLRPELFFLASFAVRAVEEVQSRRDNGIRLYRNDIFSGDVIVKVRSRLHGDGNSSWEEPCITRSSKVRIFDNLEVVS
jgi:hypothetical protein